MQYCVISGREIWDILENNIIWYMKTRQIGKGNCNPINDGVEAIHCLDNWVVLLSSRFDYKKTISGLLLQHITKEKFNLI